ncbi:MAG: OmpH family outer membrane protein [Bacteroidales bacterium]|nr:OmpH family outer membrane protein [Bacteroidales bacterium]
MRKLAFVVTFIALFFFVFNAQAQTKVKLAHINSAELMKIMPGIDTAQKVLEDYQAQLQDEFKAMYSEYEKKTMDFQDRQATMSQSLQQVKIKELQDLESRIKTFESSAQEDFQNKQEVTLTPIIDRAKAAIAEVAKELGYTYVFDTSLGVLLYQEESDNIFEAVKKKIGIK